MAIRKRGNRFISVRGTRPRTWQRGKLQDKAVTDALKRHYDSLTEVVVELDGKEIFRGHRDSRELKWILRDNPTAIVIKGELR